MNEKYMNEKYYMHAWILEIHSISRIVIKFYIYVRIVLNN